MDELKLKELEIFDYKKRLAESEAKFRQQQNLFEAVRAERNTCSKALIEAHDEIEELKSKLKIMSHQVEQLKEDVTSKETSLVKEEFRELHFLPRPLQTAAEQKALSIKYQARIKWTVIREYDLPRNIFTFLLEYQCSDVSQSSDIPVQQIHCGNPFLHL